MGREVHFAEKEFVLKLTGVVSLFALKWELKIPYKAIKSVYIDEFDPPMWMLRMPGTAIAPLNIFEGSFKFADEWYFLSYEHKVPLVNLELDGSGKYKYIIFEVQNPRDVLIELRKKINDTDPNI
jgi:hypothetical protein